MELIDILRPLGRWWWLVLIPTIIALIASLPSVPTSLRPPHTYGATIRFSAAAPPTAMNELAAANDNLARSGTYEDTAYVPWLASEYLVVNLPQWVTSSRFANAVSEELAKQGFNIDAKDVQAAFNADGARSIFVVYYGWDNEPELEAIINASIVVLQTRTSEVFPQLATEPAMIIPLDDIHIVSTAPSITARLRPFIQVLIGLLAGIGLAYLAAYLDNYIHNKHDLETLELSVLGEIPSSPK
ncbi:MAG: hypothetical protein CUN55_01370 [Phototrophicales bacterium]|nr:MAG: hypothetical protein CUN55_01370 [Phototrophicales bacterium]